MSEISATQSATQGIQAAQQQMDQAAHRLSNPSTNPDLAKDIVTMKEAKHAVEVNAAVLRAASETKGTIVDIFA